MTDSMIERLTKALQDRYAIEAQVGQGGMAVVYLAEDLKHHRRVAIKVLRPELAASVGSERFLREIRLAARLQHPHIVPVYDSGSADGILYFVMPFIAGESLRDLMLREGRVDLARAATILQEAASGLAFAHAHGVVHRDVKPENILLSGGHAVVTDFGIARAVDASRTDQDSTGAGMALGTPAYMSPEQAGGEEANAPSDQYSLACVYFELVTGKPAFRGASVQALLAAILAGPRPALSAMLDGIPDPIDHAIRRALSTDPSDRFASITDFAHAVTRESSGVAAATRESRKWKRLALVLPVLVAAAALVWTLVVEAPLGRVVPGAESIAVVPFATTGPGLEGIGEGMVDLLSSSLGGVGDIQTVDPRTVLREWHRRVGPGPGDLNDALAVARSTKAASVLTGSVVTTGTTARLSAALYDLKGTQLSQATIDGPADSVLTLSNSLALALLRDIWRAREPLPSANASGIRSHSVAAIRAYLDGERFHRRGEWDSAEVAFEEAVQEDSTFALAWFKLANTLGWKGAYQGSAAMAASQKAVRYSDSLPSRLRSLLYASDLFNHAANAAIDSARSYTRRYPGDADGWYLLGEAQYHGRSYRPLSPEQLRAPFDRVLAIDSSLTQAAIHPLELAIVDHDSRLITRYAAVFDAAKATAELNRVRLIRQAMSGSDSATAALFDGAVGSGFAVATLNAHLTSDSASGDRLLSQLTSLASLVADEGSRARVRALAGLFGASVGRVDSARAYLRRPGSGDNDGLVRVEYVPLLTGFETPDALARFDSAFARRDSGAPSIFREIREVLVALDRREPARALAVATRSLRSGDSLPPVVRGTLVGLSGLAIAATGDTARALTLGDSGRALIGSSLSLLSFSAAFQLRFALLESRIPSRREAALNRLRWGFWNTPEFFAARERALGSIFDAAGERDSALVHYQRFLALWDRPDSTYFSIAQSVRDAVTRLSGERSTETPLTSAKP